MVEAKINRDKYVGLWLDEWKEVSSPVPFSWTEGQVSSILGVWFGFGPQLEMKWSAVRKNVKEAAHPWTMREIFA